MKPFFRSFLQPRPCLRQALLWSIPALVAGAALRLIALHYNPYAYWSEDSRSYADFAYQLFDRGEISLNKKRRYTYPIFLTIPYALPGSALRWTAWLQHAAMLAATVGLAYMVRKIFRGWKLLVIPLTCLYALHPYFLYFSDQMLAEAPFVIALIAAMAGWTAWVHSPAETRARFSRFALFFAPFAILMLTKPSGRFLWPGLLVALVIIFAWRFLRRPHYIALLVLLLISPTVGERGQGLRLLYSSAFPLTRLDTPLHAEYKAEIAPLVSQARSQLHQYYDSDKEYKNFLEDPAEHTPRLELWAALESDQSRKDRLYRDLALEGILHEPHLMVYISLQRILGSHLQGLKESRVTGEYYTKRIEKDYFYRKLSQTKPALLKRLFGLKWDAPMPPVEYFQQKVHPHPESSYDDLAEEYLNRFEKALAVLKRVDTEEKFPAIHHMRPTWLGWLLLAGLALSFARPYRSTLGCWALIMLSYLFGVYAVGSMNGRFLLPILPLVILLWLVPLDALVRLVSMRHRQSAAPAV